MAMANELEDFADEIQEVIVNKTDLREPGYEFNDNDIYECIGQLRMVYNYSEHGNYKPEATGSGTVFYVQNTSDSDTRKAFILTAAHNVRHKIIHCSSCDYYMDIKHTKCRGCNATVTKNDLKLINPTEITFKRRSRKQHSFGHREQRYDDCSVEYINDEKYKQFYSIKSGYDWCILSIIDKHNYYNKFVSNIMILPTTEIWNKCLRFDICGYPCYKPSKFLTDEEEKTEITEKKRTLNNGLYGMSSNQIKKMKFQSDDMGTTNIFIHQTAIDTEGGQSGACFFCKGENLKKDISNDWLRKKTIIFSIHVGGSTKGKYNVGTIITNQMLCKIYDVCGIKTSIQKVDIDDIKSDNIFDPFNGKQKKEFKAHVAMSFSNDGITVAIRCPSGEIIFQPKRANDVFIKEPASILIQESDEKEQVYNLISFGLEASQTYQSMNEKNLLYFENFIVEMKEELKAQNGQFVSMVNIFAVTFDYIKQQIMDNFKKVSDIKNVSDCQWILIIPSFWSECKSIILKGAQIANINDPKIMNHTMIITEQECISVWVKDSIDIVKGMKYVLIDIGQDTTNVSSHIIVSENMSKRLLQPEIYSFGSNNINEQFYEKLGEIFGKDCIDTAREKLKNNFIKAMLYFDGIDNPIINLNNEFVKFIENKRGKCVEDIVDEYDAKSESIECDEDSLELTIKIWKCLFNSLLEPLFINMDKMFRNKVMKDCVNILLIGKVSQSMFLQNEIENKYGEIYRIHTVCKQHLAAIKGAFKIGLQTVKWKSRKTIGILTDNCGFCPLVRKGELMNTYSCSVQWFRIVCVSKYKQVIVKVYNEIDSGKYNEIGYLSLANCKYDEPIGIVYVDTFINKKIYIVSKNWSGNKREIWSEEFGW